MKNNTQKYTEIASSRDLIVKRSMSGAYDVERESQLNAVYRLYHNKQRQTRADAFTYLIRKLDKKVKQANKDYEHSQELLAEFRHLAAQLDASTVSNHRAQSPIPEAFHEAILLNQLMKVQAEKDEADRVAEKSASWRRGDHPMFACVYFLQGKQFDDGKDLRDVLRKQHFYEAFNDWLKELGE